MLLYIVRHGEPNYEKDCLTENGLLQAEAVGKRIAASGIDRIFCSPMGRAKETAEPACRLLGMEPFIEEWAHEIGSECHIPLGDGKKPLSLLPNVCFRQNGCSDLPYERAHESAGFNQCRMKTAVDYIEENGKDFLERFGYKEENGVYRILYPNEEKIALFCHANFARAWLSVLLHIPIHMVFASFDITHTGVTVLKFENYESGFTAPQCICLSDVSHLYAEGLDMKYNNIFEI